MVKNVIHIKQLLGGTLNTRDQAGKLMRIIRSGYPDVNDLVLDFLGVDFMSRSFADQFHKELNSYIRTANIHMQIADTHVQIIDVLHAVSKTQRKDRSFIEYPTYTCVDRNAFMDYLQSI